MCGIISATLANRNCWLQYFKNIAVEMYQVEIEPDKEISGTVASLPSLGAHVKTTIFFARIYLPLEARTLSITDGS